MERIKVLQKTQEIAKQVLRQSKVTYMSEIFDYIPNLIDSVVVDKEHIIHCVEQELGRKSKNPINAILKMFGIKIVRLQSTIDHLSQAFSGNGTFAVRETECDAQNALLNVDEKKLREILAQMAERLADVEQTWRMEKEGSLSKTSLIHEELNKTSRQYEQMRAAYVNQKKIIADRVQYILSLNGPDLTGSPIAVQIAELLEDMNIQVYWDAKDALLPEKAMFSTYITKGPTRNRRTPCLISDGKVISKGIVLTPEEHVTPKESQSGNGME